MNIQRPRVFLSHSKKDTEFIHRLEADLRKALCEPWIDDIEIRHGKPWLDEIFRSGIPSCETVLCYVTPNSVESKVVQMELNARVVEQLESSNVSLLLYVSSDDVRGKLRADLRQLQAPVLDDESYSRILPRIVAEVYQAHLTWALAEAVKNEKLLRLEAELRLREIESANRSSVFSSAEESDFRLIREWMNQKITAYFEYHEPESKQPVKFEKPVWFPSLYAQSIFRMRIKIHMNEVEEVLRNEFLKERGATPGVLEVALDPSFALSTHLLRFGLLERQQRQQFESDRSSPLRAFRREQSHMLVLTPKFDRFNYWLDYTKALEEGRASVFECE